jgi:hypothetical protein
VSVATAPARHPARHVRPRRQRVRTLVKVRIPSAVNTVWDFAEAYPRFAIAAALLAAAALMAWWLPVGASLVGAVTVFLLGRGVGLIQAATVRENLADAERELAAARTYGAHVAAELEAVRADLAALTAASTRTQRLPAVEDGEDQ